MTGQRESVFLLLGAGASLAAAVAGAIAAIGIFGVSWAVLHGALKLRALEAPGGPAYIMVGLAGFHGTLLWGAIRQARRLGGGDWRLGSGLRPVAHKLLIGGLCVLMAGWVAAFIGLVSLIPGADTLARSTPPGTMLASQQAGPVGQVLWFALLGVLAPAAEELFFRGWLWEALSRRHGIWTTAGVTSGIWLVPHGIDSMAHMIFLVPAALVLSFARHKGRSVLASLAVHLTNNTTALLGPTAMVFLGHP